MKEVEGFGWSYEIDLDLGEYTKDDIIKLSDIVDDIAGISGVGFMLCVFHFGEKDIKNFQEQTRYFPYDAYLSLWEEFYKGYDIPKRKQKIDPSSLIETKYQLKYTVSTIYDWSWKCVQNIQSNHYFTYLQRNACLEYLVKHGHIIEDKIGKDKTYRINKESKYLSFFTEDTPIQKVMFDNEVS